MIDDLLSYIKTKTMMSFRLKPGGGEQSSVWVHISDKEIETRFLQYSDGFDRHNTIEQLIQEGVICKRKVTAPGRRPYNIYRLTDAYWEMVRFDITLLPVKPLQGIYKTMAGYLSHVSIDIDSFADVLTPEYMAYFRMFLKYRNTVYVDRFVTVCDFAHRFHSPITNLNRHVRPYIKLDGDDTTGLDVATMQPTILAAILDKYVPGNTFSRAVFDGQDIYVYLQQKAGKQTRDEGKK